MNLYKKLFIVALASVSSSALQADEPTPINVSIPVRFKEFLDESGAVLRFPKGNNTINERYNLSDCWAGVACSEDKSRYRRSLHEFLLQEEPIQLGDSIYPTTFPGFLADNREKYPGLINEWFLDDEGTHTALDYACKYSRKPATIETLCEAGANPNNFDPEGYCPLEIVADREYLSDRVKVEFMDILLRYGANQEKVKESHHELLKKVADMRADRQFNKNGGVLGRSGELAKGGQAREDYRTGRLGLSLASN